jgi:alpha-galactosidase
MPAPKIVIIGAGSASFGPNTLATIMRNQHLKGSSLALVDLDSPALDILQRLAERINIEWDAQMDVVVDSNRQNVLSGADFVIVSIEVQPREKLWRQDWELTLKHGLRQPYGENGGPGGLMHACRQIGPFMDIVKDMETLCPGALLINYSNPLPRITRAVTKYSKIRIVGKCHQLSVGYAIAATLLADHLGIVPPENANFGDGWFSSQPIMTQIGRERLDIKAAGLNHFTWMVDVRDKKTGEDLYPALRAASERVPDSFQPLSMELFQLFGYCPVAGDSHLSEYLPWTHDPTTKPWERYNIHLYDWGQGETERQIAQTKLKEMAIGTRSLDELKDSSSEGAVELIEAITGKGNHYDEAVNIPNSGRIPNLPDDTIVELPAIVNKLGVNGISMDPLPDPIAELCRREAILVEFVVDAAVTGNYDTALQALLFDPMINDIGRARAILDDYLVVFDKYLPQFSAQ